MEVLVLIDFEGTMGDELTVHAGDVVTNVASSGEEGWLLGELRGKKGIFPSNFVKEVPNYLTGDSQREPRSMRKPTPVKMSKEQCKKCEVTFAYSPTHEDELELVVGETIEILKEIEDGWWMGKKNGKIGAFPCNFVKEIVSPKDAKLTEGKSRPKLSEAVFIKQGIQTQRVSTRKKTNVKECCQVMFDYTAITEDELNLKKGDTVTIINKVTDDEGWWEGELNGQRGFFPDNFVMVIPTDTLQDKSQPPLRRGSQKQTVKQVSGMEKSKAEAAVKTDTTDGKPQVKDMPGKIKLPGMTKLPPPPVKDKPHKSGPRTGDEQPPPSPKLPENKAKDSGQFEGVDVSSAKLSHPTAYRAKPPQRRPPTNVGTSGQVSTDGHQSEAAAETDAGSHKVPAPAKDTENHLPSATKEEHPVIASAPPHPTPATAENEATSPEEKPSLDQVLAEVKELRMALELFKTRHTIDIQDLKNELSEERNKRMKLQDEVQLLKKQK
ncbi:SH3 domain-containing protein 21 [Brachyhypopomus gauderio]|uniref:SH3 domain-containing protein 21 n=1 Tax=Brachyhypopomus gauderio TaxID=698409 RepID=UPI0040436B08